MKYLREYVKQIIKENLNPGDSIVYCDMDGVLVDFSRGARELINSILGGERDDLVSTSKSIRRSLRKIHRDLSEDFRVSSHHDLDLKPIRSIMMSAVGKRAGEYFRDLPPLDDGINRLWPYINNLGQQVNILSAPIEAKKGITAAEGKTLWVQRWLQPQPLEIVIVPAKDKQLHAISPDGTRNILIDDKKRTIDEWNAAGGIGIIHFTEQSNDTIRRLKGILSDISKEGTLI